MSNKKTAVITGATRGLGLGCAEALAEKGYLVYLLGRDPKRLEEAQRAFSAKDRQAKTVTVDLADPLSIEKASAQLLQECASGIDVLINNAGILIDAEGGYSREKVATTLQTNTLGPLQLAVALAPLVAKRRGNIVNVSSGMGELHAMGAGYPGYRISKTALNGVTCWLSAEWSGKGVRVNSVCPGWVKTDMGGAGAERSIPEGVKSILFAALLEEGGPTAGFFRDGKKLEW
jgi:NAD(P)-dependent dehydrogenase (short-subunit alcohol dehydrogenase family)